MVVGRRWIARLAGGAVVASSMALAGCNSITYGTGVGPMEQTMNDFVSIVSFKHPDPIVYQECTGIALPPDATLPPPGTGGQPRQCTTPDVTPPTP